MYHVHVYLVLGYRVLMKLCRYMSETNMTKISVKICP